MFQHLKCDDDVYSGGGARELQELTPESSCSSQESEHYVIEQGYEADSEVSYDDHKCELQSFKRFGVKIEERLCCMNGMRSVVLPAQLDVHVVCTPGRHILQNYTCIFGV